MDPENITPEFIADLLAQPSAEARSAFLQSANLLTEEGLDGLLNFATEIIGNDPGQARQISILCAETAEAASAPIIVPRSNYLRAQTHAIHGEFSQASTLIRAAHGGYLSLGQAAAALRTNVGLIGVLAEEGKYEEAISVGLSTLVAIDHNNPAGLSPVHAKKLSGLIYKNLGICYELIGNYDQALNVVSTAETMFREAGMDEESAALAMNRGSIFLNLGRAREALTVFQGVVPRFASLGSRLRQARCLNNLAYVHLLLGNYNQSLEILGEARDLLDALDARADQSILHGLAADVYLALNLYPEAIAEYRIANEGLREMGMAYQRAWVLWGLGAALTAQSQWEEAEAMLAEAANLFHEAGNRQLLSGVLLEQAQLLAIRNERSAAIQNAWHSLQLVVNEDWPVQRAYALLGLVDLVLPDVSLAETLLLECQRITSTLALPQLQYRVAQRLGHLFLLQGRDQEAELLLEAAVTAIEQLRGNLTQEAFRVSFLRDKITAYENLAQLYLLRGDEESLRKALNVTERAKSRTLVELIMGLVETKLAAEPPADASARLEMMRAELNAIYNQALRGAQDGERAVPWHELNERAISLSNEINRLHLELADKGIPTSPTSVLSFDKIQAQFPSDLTALTYHILAEEVLVFVSQNRRLRVKRHLTDISTVRKLLDDLDMEWTRFQAGESFIRQHLPHLERSVRHVLQNLYQCLIAPIADWLPDSEEIIPRLGIVPHGLLHEVPFQALFDGEGYLVDRFELVYAPSTMLLAHYQQPRPLRNDRGMVFGVSDPLIPSVVVESQAVARHLPHMDLFLNDQATLAAFQTQVSQSGILHLACHGLFRADNPMFSALRLYDGWLTAADVLAIDLIDTFVTLSACESGRSDRQRGDEILGLTRAFLGAGTRALLVTLWLVEDEASASLMDCLYEQLAKGADYATALRTAQRTLKERLPHPYYWAPFVLIGQTTSTKLQVV
ncbi:MAG TPA: CHAT domain-containing tetratricopeptide repeat protein [Anaerolineales bacterium]|nr:CHAT domain-containing tetratricopeptide repeat protein [Anaerolineales bacterium]